ncbi:MAG: hypothetical protein KDD56_09425, partial [Bdellovibrionales bacterium]|nr:hypothetical protein [Bdellovibrionales bacterium]
VAGNVSGEFKINQISDGDRRLSLRLVDLNGKTIGKTDIVKFKVKTALSTTNAKKVKSLLKKAVSGKIDDKKLKQLNKTLKQMKKAGFSNPDFPEVNSEDVKKAISILKKIKSKKISKKIRKEINFLFK